MGRSYYLDISCRSSLLPPAASLYITVGNARVLPPPQVGLSENFWQTFYNTIPSPYYMNKTTTSPHSCISHRRTAAHRRAGGKRALRLLIFRFWVDFEEIYLYFGPPRGPAPRISPSAVTAGHEAAFHIGALRGVRGPDGACCENYKAE